MRVSLFTDYSLRTLMYLVAHRDEKSSVASIAEYYGISRNHLVKIAHRLGQLGYIETTKGKGGGIQIAQGAEKLRLGDLIEQLEPNMNIAECFDAENNNCRITDSCKLKHYLQEGAQQFVDTLNKYTLEDTISKGASPFSVPLDNNS